jgi:hypothetical protein
MNDVIATEWRELPMTSHVTLKTDQIICELLHFEMLVLENLEKSYF